MSNGRRICVCGRERGKEPVIITITTCRRKHSPKGEGSLCISSPPLATSSPTNVTAKSKSKKEDQSAQSEATQNKSAGKSNDDDDDGPGYTTALDANETAYETAREEITDDSHYETALEPDANDTVEDTAYETAQEDETTVNQDETTDDTGYAADDSAAADTTNDDTNDPTVMMLTETAVNTMPFLDNLFWPKSNDESEHRLSDDQAKKVNCTLELLIFEKHTQDCKHNMENLRNGNSFFDGDSCFESVGRISFPTCTELNGHASKGGSLASLLKGGYNIDSENAANAYKNLFKTLEAYMKNKQFYDKLNQKSLVPFDGNLSKYITLAKDPDKALRYDVEELFKRKVTVDRSVQFESVYTSNVRAPKWYDGFLICFGLKTTEDVYDIGSLKDELMPRTESSFLVTKYLKV